MLISQLRRLAKLAYIVISHSQFHIDCERRYRETDREGELSGRNEGRGTHAMAAAPSSKDSKQNAITPCSGESSLVSPRPDETGTGVSMPK